MITISEEVWNFLDNLILTLFKCNLKASVYFKLTTLCKVLFEHV